VTHRLRQTGLQQIRAAALAIGFAAAAPALAAPPTPTPTASVAGAWVERDVHYRFEIRTGATPDQLVVTLPKDVPFPGDHIFLLTRTGPASFASKEQPNRPKVAVSFRSATRGELKVAGAGNTHAPHGGAWMMMNDFTLVRP
jgi:hypothetical protein